MVWKIVAVLWMIMEVWLSHENGQKSGEESRWLAEKTRIEEGWLRRAAHVVLFSVLGLFAGLGWGWYEIGIVGVWAVVDETTKPLIPGRHFSWIDVGLNLIGEGIGILIWILLGAG